MSDKRSVNLLPEIFRTTTNRKFLSATLDQLTQEPQTRRTQGYVGRKIGPGVNPQDNYVIEPTAERANYQLEPAVTFLKDGTNTAIDAITYPGMIDTVNLKGGDTQRQDRLWNSQYYAWDPFCDLDKFTNFSQYYWLPEGPLAVDISSTAIPISDSFTVVRSTDNYSFSGIAGQNPTLILVRGGNYNFVLDQPGHNFWIQAAPGISGSLPSAPNISSRDVLGVRNNGADGGVVTFDVPLKTAQNFYYSLQDLGNVDLVTDLKFNQINNIYVDQFFQQFPDGIDGIGNLDRRTVIFTNRILDAAEGGWQITTQFDPLIRTSPSGAPDSLDGTAGSFDSIPFDQTTDISLQSQRYSVWRINYVPDSDGNFYMTLTSVNTVPNLSKLQVKFGTQESGTSWYKNSAGFFEKIPLLTAVQDDLWYQDSTNPEIFGRIRLVDSSTDVPIDLNEIIGASSYTSPNGVTLTNGLKIQFRDLGLPDQFRNQEFYVEGVGTGPGIDARVGFVDGEAYFGPFHIENKQKITGLPNSGVFQQFIYDSIEESLANKGRGTPDNAPLAVLPLTGTTPYNGIRLVPVRDLVTPETYTQSETIPFDATLYDSTPFDSNLNAPLVPDYITINRASRDKNAWSRSNRWFHIDVIELSATFNNQLPIFDNSQRAKRPIIEFRSDIDLWNFGSQGLPPVDVIDFSQTDALSNVNGTTGYGVDGFELINGSRIIFAADRDPLVRNSIYTVEFIRPDGDPNTPLQINLVSSAADQVVINQTVVCLSGITQQGTSYWFDGANWILAQQKTRANQPPLFDIFDKQGNSLGDQSQYPSSNFRGSKLFGYALSDQGLIDDVLGFALRYQTLNNVGDIVFENYIYTDTFDFVQNNVGVTQAVSQGFVRQYVDRVSFTLLIGWQPAITENFSRQVFRFVSDNPVLILDVAIDDQSLLPPLQVFVDAEFYSPDRYTFTVANNNTFVSFNQPLPPGLDIQVLVLSAQTSLVAYYQVPINLENNPLNGNSDSFTLGTIRKHYETIGINLTNLSGPINGANNSRDLGNILRYGTNIVQNSSPLTLAGVFLRDAAFDIFDALTFNDQQYSIYKARLIELAAKGNFIDLSASNILDAVIEEIAVSKSQTSPFYWSDMIPAGDTFVENSYTVSPITTQAFDTVQTYDFDSSNYLALSIYINDILLTRNYEYLVPAGSRTVTILIPLAVGDKVRIREYSTTVGSFVPNTPTKLGLYPAYRPEIFYDNTYVNPTQVIRGHDGSITVAYGDIRDQILLEFETRIFNNLKINTQVPLQAQEVIPGQFRNTDYSLAEINQILSRDFLSWVAWNKLDYISQTYQADNEFTYNYSQSGNRLDGAKMLGAWRGVYNDFYDTIYPNTRPWEMLGFSQQPSWWESRYGPAPYTSGNLVLWEDLEAGIVRDPNGAFVLPRFARPGLTRVIPSDSEGNLLSPLDAIVGQYDSTSFRRSWTFGDDGPTENAWRTSSSWPFALMRLFALTKPAKFFSLGVNRDRYKFDAGLDQWLWDDRYRLDANQLQPLYGSGQSQASFINWIIDFNQQQGLNSSQQLASRLRNIDVRLAWRVAGYTDKKYLKIFAERSTPTGTNTGLLLPDESYSVLLYKNQAFAQALYSSVIIQRTADGWSVLGYNAAEPYFNILVSRAEGKTRILQSGGFEVPVATEYTDLVSRVPYGYVFKNRPAVCDFLLSYGQLLQRQGFTFEGIENGLVMNWNQMAQEFLYWSSRGWIEGSVINLNPGATTISVTRPGAVAESLTPTRVSNLVLNQNRQPLTTAQLVIDRLDNTFSISSTTTDTINYLNLKLTAYEHLVILDNRSIFADLIYDPITGSRQSRVRVAGIISANWNGTVNAPGFILNENNIQPWQSNQTYTKGEIVDFKDQYYTASTIIQPSQAFDYSQWIKTDRDLIKTGLLPNSANTSDQLIEAYDINSVNLEQEVNLFSYGLIGFRPRDYMQALNLDDVSQVNLYREFIASKGTRRSAEAFSLADLGKETAEYKIYEYWQILQSLYGANANRNFVEILLDAPRLTSDPNLIQIVNPGEISQADQTVLVSQLWQTSYAVGSPDVLPVSQTNRSELMLPSAGYVNLQDVDLTLFDIDDPADLNNNLDSLGVGTRIWIAKVNPYDWNVYTAERVPGLVIQVRDNLNGLSLVTFDKVHGLGVGDIFILKYLDVLINGAYRVIAVPSIFDILIEYTFPNGQLSVQGNGVGFTLDSVRVDQPASIANLDLADTLTPGARVWVDQDIDGGWTVLEKNSPWQNSANLDPPGPNPQVDSEFGYSIAQGFFNLTALIGAPRYQSVTAPLTQGGIFVYGLGDSDVLEFNSILTPSIENLDRLGHALDIGNQTWAVAGAPDSETDVGYALVLYREPGSDFIEVRQILIADDTDLSSAMNFGSAVTISQDERYIYVGAPAADAVYAYARVDVQFQTIEYETNGVSAQFNWTNGIILPTYSAPFASFYPQQMSVTLNNEILVYGIDWVEISGNVVLTVVPPAGQQLIISRRTIDQLDRENFYDVDPAISTSSAGTGARFDIEVLRGIYNVTLVSGGTDYEVGDQLTILGTQVGGATPANDILITVTAPAGREYRATLTAGVTQFRVNDATGLVVGQTLTKISGDGSFGAAAEIVNISDDLITANVVNASSGLIRFYAEPNSITTFITSGSPALANTFDLVSRLAPVTGIDSFTITVNNDIYRPYFDYIYSSATGEVTFLTSPPLGSTILVAATDHFYKVATINSSTPGIGFGSSVTTTTNGDMLLVGAPDFDSGKGKVFAYSRSGEKFVVYDSEQTDYVPVESLLPVVSVRLNGENLLNSDYNINAGFSIDFMTNTVTILTPLAVGDVIEIGNNSFALIEEIQNNEPMVDARFGDKVDQCINDCSLYISAPRHGSVVPQGGQVEFLQNQSRIYGTITSHAANPVLTAGDYLKINGQSVRLSQPSVWNSSTAWNLNDFVLAGAQLFKAIQNVPIGIDISNRLYWQVSSWLAVLKNDIEKSVQQGGVPNVTLTISPDLILTGNGSSTSFDIGDVYASAVAYNTVVYVGTSAFDAVLQTPGVDYVYNNTNQTINFVTPPFNGAYIQVVTGKATFSIKNPQSGQVLNLLTVLPMNGDTLFSDLELQTYVRQQTILPPIAQDYARFGSSIFISDNTETLTVGAPNGSMIVLTEFDSGRTVFDARSTTFSDITLNSGSVYTFDFLPAHNASVNNPGQFVFGQQIVNTAVRSLDLFGQSVDLTTGTLLIGAPGSDLDDSSGNFGTVFQANNANNQPAWQVLRDQTPVVDINLLNGLYIYNVGDAQVNSYLDYFDPLQGKLLGPVRQNLDYIGSVNPAQFNVGPINDNGLTWRGERVGDLWWDTTNCRFLDPNQNDITYASRRWGQTFPGSRIDIYQWIASDVPPVSYAGPGVPRSIDSYSVSTGIDDQGIIQETYYFWVAGINTVARDKGKTLSAVAVAQYIESPRSSGLAYLAPINSSTVALYNCFDFINDTGSVLHVEFDRTANDAAVHAQYELVADGRAADFLNDSLYRKLLDSFCGTDSRGNLVPDPFLPPSQKYGVSFRPRQSFFVNRFGALQNYLTSVNEILKTLPVAESRFSPLLNSEEPEPSAASGQWNARVANLQELSYQNLRQVNLGYRYLVESDSSNRGLWSIYEVQAGRLLDERVLGLIRVQNFNTKFYWQYIDWYRVGFDPASEILAQVQNIADLAKLDLPAGSYVKVLANQQQKWEIYERLQGAWQRVGLQSGTIEFSRSLWDYQSARFGFDSEVFDNQYFDQEPVIETRQIIRAINQELLIDELLLERNRLLILIFNYILSEQTNPSWLNKTSLIDVDHIIRQLEPFQIYRRDNQDFVLNYIQEVKPYHSQIREFNLIYQGDDAYQGTMTDFDLPAQWDANQQLFVSPVLDDGTVPLSTTSSIPSTSPIWQELPYNQWFDNYLLNVESVEVLDGGQNYTVAPEVSVIGTSARPAVMTARINSAGRVIAIDIVDPGAGYLTTASLVMTGGNGTGARAVAVMGNQTVRQIKTVVSFDRYQYSSNIVDWQLGDAYALGTRVRYENRVWQANTNIPAQSDFDTEQWDLVPAGVLSGVDRTQGFYVPTQTEPGRDLALLMTGIDYPGVQVSGPRFNQNTGFDVGNFDINPFDNIDFDAAGNPTYDPGILDAIYESVFDDPFLGVRAAPPNNGTESHPLPTFNGDPPNGGDNPIVVSGGAFVDTYSSHAPEELIPGAMFDTLDLRVFTTPGSDWEIDGHGFPIYSRRYTFDENQSQLDWSNMLDFAVYLTVTNVTTGTLLSPLDNYTVDWVNYTVLIASGINDGELIDITAAALGGGNQLLSNTSVGNGTVTEFLISRPTVDISEIVAFINGVRTTAFALVAVDASQSKLVLNTPLLTTQRLTFTAMGFGVTSTRSWSLPVTQYWVSDGSTSLTLNNSLQGTNPANIVVSRLGRRATPAAGIEYTSDGSTDTFDLPRGAGYSLDLVADNDVSVYVDNRPLTLGTEFVVNAYDFSSENRSVSIIDVPAPQSAVLISVRTGADYFINGNVLQFRSTAGFLPQPGDIVSVTTWNDTSEQNILTKVFVGPEDTSILVSQGYDTTGFDEGDVTGAIDSFDYSSGVIEQVNRFDLGREILDTNRLLVTLDGVWLFANIGYTIDGSVLEIPGPIIATNAVLAVTMFTDSTVPGEIAFRIFQDMRGQQNLYRITAATSTTLVQDLSASGDIIHVADANNMPQPNLELGIFGLITINGERIAYRDRNTATNTLSGLRRGTLGTAAAGHLSGQPVYSISASNLLPRQYQNTPVTALFEGDGSTSVFDADNIRLFDLDSTQYNEAVQVRVGGQLQVFGSDYDILSVNPVSVDFVAAPLPGYQVEISVTQAQSMYQPGVGTPSDGVPLQETQTLAARFIRDKL